MNTKTKAAEYVAGNVDVLLEILVRLPVKPLVRFKLVSKQWCSHISDPQFVNSYVRWNPNKSTGIFLCALNIRSQDTEFVPFNALDPTYQTIPSLSFLSNVHPFVHYIKIVQSCNGLLLCKVTVSQPGKSKTLHYCVFNPTTKQFRLFPELKSEVSLGWPFGEFLAFDSSISPYYKLIVFRQFSKDHKYTQNHILVYSSENQRWRVSTSPLKLRSKFGVFMNGAIYWPDGEPGFLIGLDVITEEMIRLPLSSPKPYLGHLTKIFKGTGGRRLFCIDMLDQFAKDFRLLEMCIDESSKTANWVTKYEASVSLMQSLFPPEKPPCFGHINHLPICVVEGAKEEDLAVVLGIPGEIIFYDIMHETVNPLCELDESFRFGSVVFQFIESLYAV